jgi:nucleotide-binding universal stress UspA family protein
MDENKITRMLVAIDGSSQSQEALSLALRLADGIGAEIEIFNVIPDLPHPQIGPRVSVGGTVSEYLQEYYADQKEYSKKITGEAREKSKQDYPKLTITTKIVQGKPADAILEESERGFDVLVMGSRGLGFLDELLLGSVSDKVVHKSKIPVILSK